MFQQPPPSAGFIKTAEYAGALLLIYPKRYHEDMVGTDGKPFDGVEVELHSIAGPKAGTVETGIMTQKMIVGSLKNAIGGDPVLGRLGQGIANPGKSAPWVLTEFTAQDAAEATAYVQRVRPGIQQPPPAAAQPAAAAPAAGLGSVLGAPAAAAAPVPLPAAAAAPAAPSLAEQLNALLTAPMTFEIWATLDPQVKPVVFNTLKPEAQALLRQTGTVPAGL